MRAFRASSCHSLTQSKCSHIKQVFASPRQKCYNQCEASRDMQYSISMLLAFVGVMALSFGSYAAAGVDGVVVCLLATAIGGLVYGVRKHSRLIQLAALAVILTSSGWFAVPVAIQRWEAAVLTRDLADDRSSVRQAAFTELCDRKIDPSPDLVALLNDSNETVREFASRSLIRLLPYHSDSLLALVGALADECAAVRSNAADGIGRRLELADRQMTEPDSPAVKGLIEATEDEDPSVRYSASVALLCLGKRYYPRVVPGLVEGLASTDSVVRGNAISYLEELGPEAENALANLIEILQGDDDSFMRAAAARAIGSLGPRGAPAVPSLIDVLRNEQSDFFVQCNVAEALGRIGHASRSALPILRMLRGEVRISGEINESLDIGTRFSSLEYLAAEACERIEKTHE